MVTAGVSHAQNSAPSTGRATSYYRAEALLGWICLAFTIVAWIVVSLKTACSFAHHLADARAAEILEDGIFIIIVQAMLYGSFVYQLCRLGYLARRTAYRPPGDDARESVHGLPSPPSLAVLVPSFKEELVTLRRTLLSAALQDYPNRRVVLLIDDPPKPADAADSRALHSAKALVAELNSFFVTCAGEFLQKRVEFDARIAASLFDPAVEATRLASLYGSAADQVARLAMACPRDDHADRLLLDGVLNPIVLGLGERARRLAQATDLDITAARCHYLRLYRLFHVEIGSFQRKRFVNLSHEPNKAMNLNSYIGLMGKRWRRVSRPDGDHLEEGAGEFAPADADFILTLDADSVIVPEYAATLVYELLRPGNERLAVAQTPYNAIRGCSNLLERTAGATTDIQYLIHQGFTHYNATYWVGANALLRVAALRDISTSVTDRGFAVPVFIQDRTVIEDTESSIDLVSRGWGLYNHPERLAYSATPNDFGALLIQRRRWANGGLIILPKLLKYVAGSRGRAAEGFFRIHYLVSIALANIGFLILLGHSFLKSYNGVWLPLTALPFFLLSVRDLRYNGYHAGDLARVYALNLLLLPVNLGGVLKSLQQALTGKRIAFGRTPKISDRTRVPPRYVFAEYGLLILCVARAVLEMRLSEWSAALFHVGNGLMLAYAIVSFMGLRASMADLFEPFRAWFQRDVSATLAEA